MNTLKRTDDKQRRVHDVFTKLAKPQETTPTPTVAALQSHVQQTVTQNTTTASSQAAVKVRKSDGFREYTIVDMVKWALIVAAITGAAAIGSNSEKRVCSDQERNSIGAATHCRR